MSLGVQDRSKEPPEAPIPPSKARPTTFGWIWLAAVTAVYIAVWPAGWFDTATELTPDHSDILDYCFYVAGVLALVSGVVLFVQSKGSTIGRLGLAFVASLAGGIGSLLLSSTVANIIENRIDFPADKTNTFRGLLPIGRAYRMDSRTGSSWIIQPLIWTNIDITQSDYRFMLSHRGWSGKGSEPDDVRSDGYFCARALMQKAGGAIRVLHAGHSRLPSGTIGICSEMQAADRSAVVVD